MKLKAYRREHNLPFIPSEEEINQLISACSRKVAVFLMLLKETGVRPIEAWRLKFTDIDINTSTVKVKAAKYSRSRILKVSQQTLNNLLSLKRESEYIFFPSGREERFSEEIEYFSRNFCKQRKRIAEKLGNPRRLENYPKATVALTNVLLLLWFGSAAYGMSALKLIELPIASIVYLFLLS